MSLVGLCGLKDRKHYMIYTYLKSAKLEDSEYTNFYILQKASKFMASFALPKFPFLLRETVENKLHELRNLEQKLGKSGADLGLVNLVISQG